MHDFYSSLRRLPFTIYNMRYIISFFIVISDEHDQLPRDSNGRVINLIYVSHENAYEVPLYLMEQLNLLEIPGEALRFGQVIGQGQFGKVYKGKALGIIENWDWVTVAIKTLPGELAY